MNIWFDAREKTMETIVLYLLLFSVLMEKRIEPETFKGHKKNVCIKMKGLEHKRLLHTSY